jgi:hypothetical protein
MKQAASEIVMKILLAGFLAGSIAASHASEMNKLPSKNGGLSMSTNRSSRFATLTKRKWGIEVFGVHLTAAGYMLQFDYKVLDAKKAEALFDRRIKPYLLDTKTGAKFLVPAPEKVGQLRNVNTPEAGRTYWVLFANPAKMIKAGTQVDVVIGDFRAAGLTVIE